MNDKPKLVLPPGAMPLPAKKAFPYVMQLRSGPADEDTAMLIFHADGTMSGDVGRMQKFLEMATVDIPAPMLIQLWMIRALLPSMTPADAPASATGMQ